jgi:hypothetical protein
VKYVDGKLVQKRDEYFDENGKSLGGTDMTFDATGKPTTTTIPAAP